MKQIYADRLVVWAPNSVLNLVHLTDTTKLFRQSQKVCFVQFAIQLWKENIEQPIANGIFVWY